MTNAVNEILAQKKGRINPVRTLQLAYRKMSCKTCAKRSRKSLARGSSGAKVSCKTYTGKRCCKSCAKGSSTACIIALNKKNVLRYANLGDSGFILFRGEKILYQSPVQHHRFNLPYQLGSGLSDTPNSAYEQEIHVEDGDIVVAASDGLFDNLYSHDIEEILNWNKNDHPDKLARKLAECALRNSKDKQYYSPFAKAAKMEGFEYMGGKFDDITVIVAKIVSISS